MMIPKMTDLVLRPIETDLNPMVA